MVSYKESGDVEYYEFVSSSGVVDIKSDRLVLNTESSNMREITYSIKNDSIYYTVNKTQTAGKLNEWVRINNYTDLGYDWYLEIWVGDHHPAK